MGTFTNIYGDSEISGKSPDASGDYYLIEDRQYDHDYFLEKIMDSLTAMSDDPDQDFHIFYGGVVSDGGSGTIDITACVAKGYDNDNKKRLITLPAQTGLSLPTGYDDGRQVWATLKYDAKLGTDTRVHKASTSYHYQLDDTFYGNASGLSGITTDGLFTDSDPTGDDIILGSFTMTGTSYVDLSERTVTYQPKINGVINKQADFNSLIERTGANAYKFKDEVTSVYLRYLENGYLCYGTTSFLSDGDTWGELSTNNCKLFSSAPGNKLSIGDTAFSINIKSSNSVVDGVWAKGIGSTAVNISYTFKQDSTTTNVIINNCKVSDRLFTTGAHSCFLGCSDRKTKITNCSVVDVQSDVGLYGFKDCTNISNCFIDGLSVISGSGILVGFDYCKNINNSNVDSIGNSGTGATYGFNYCENISSCEVIDVESSKLTYGFFHCNQVSSCSADTISSVSDTVAGFKSCEQVSACISTNINSDASYAYGFSSCNFTSACEAKTVTGVGDAYGFQSCYYISSCYSTDITSSGGTAIGIGSCKYITACGTPELVNPNNDYADTTEIAITNKTSCYVPFT